MKSPLNITWKSELIPLGAVLATIITAIWSYGSLPTRVMSHWNFSGEADGWSSRNFHVFFFPGLISVLYLLFLAMPSIDPRKERYQEFSRVYSIFRGLILFFLFAVYLIATLANLGYDVRMGQTMPLLIGLMMIIIGNYMGKIKNNWFMGIRTPWTLSSENVWLKTHRLGGLMFVLFGLSLIIMPYLPQKAGFALFVVGVSSVVIVPMVASYVFYKNEKR